MSISESNSTKGMTLVEILIAMSLFVITAAGVTGTLMQTQRMAYQAVYENAAFNAAQGFLEQMRSMTYADFSNVYNDPNNVSLPTLSTSSAGANVVVEDPLNYYVDELGVYDSSEYDEKLVVVDSRWEDGNEIEITMTIRFRLKLRDLSVDVEAGQTPWTAFEVTLGYEYEVPSAGGMVWKEGTLVTVIAKHEI